MTAERIESLRRFTMERYGFGTEEMKRTKVCAFCGAKSGADDKSCTQCGKELPKQTLFEVYKNHHVCCKYCDTVLAENAYFCPQCGRKADRSATR